MSMVIPLIFIGFLSLIGLGIWMHMALEKSIQKRFQEASSNAIVQNLETILTLAKKTLQEETRNIGESLAGNEKNFKALVSELVSQVKN